MKMEVVARTTFEGIHRWEEAPEEVFFLRTNHRHIFNVEVHVEVNHDDRDVEFIMLKHRLNEYFDVMSDMHGVYMMETKSCEQVALDLNEFLTHLGYHATQIHIFEDNENGAIIYF